MSGYMLDTNIASYIIKGASDQVRTHLTRTPMAEIHISAVTEAELRLGLAKVPNAKTLRSAVKAFLLRVESVPWDSAAAKEYAELRSASERVGKVLGNMDMLIAAHAKSAGMTLVTNDQAFFNIEHLLDLTDWTKA